ncbi:hypothetical protein H5410_014980 [Solanum commersonii]|uniref:Uncharacterized protein n=1 Tax=Solanum commersonii TaxID=4109 RepID=A0A9J5ZT11_SOLCO|nr:hypothetical protein H5410_014980 [Solanum commersonii]
MLLREAWDLSQGTKTNCCDNKPHECRLNLLLSLVVSKTCEVSCKSCKRRHRRNGRKGSCPIEPIYIREVVRFDRQ